MKRLVVLGAWSVLGFVACGGPGGVTLSGEAATKWNTLCVSCHGESGIGDGPQSKTLAVKPRSFGDQAWQKGITDEGIKKVIVEGGAAVGKSELMPPNPDLKGKAEVLDQLVAKVRSWRQ